MNLWTALRCSELPFPTIITLVGAGGKTTLLRRLGEEARAHGVRTLLTTTTRMWQHQFEAIAPHAYAPSQDAALAAARNLAAGDVLMLARAPMPAEGKVTGIPPSWVDALAQAQAADLIIVEGDGSRERPLKAPAPHEPAVPQNTALFVVVAGWRGVGRPLGERTVHRPDRFARLAGIRVGEPISPNAVARVLAHREGGLKGSPAHARRVLLINQLDTEAALEAARALVHRAPLWPPPPAEPPYREIVLAALAHPVPVYEVHGRVAAVVLAAGAGERFGGPKQIAPWRGKPLILHVLDAVAAAAVDEIVVVLGAHQDRVRPVVERWRAAHARGKPVRLVPNPHWAEGLSTSVRAGLRALGPVSAALFPLADQPRISSALLDALIQRHRQTLAPAVVPTYGDKPGAPVLFDARLFPELMELQGDVGGRVLVRKYQEAVAWVAWDVSAGQDVDRPADLDQLA